ncbi:chorismate-binding protein, partial [Campylobacter coli]
KGEIPMGFIVLKEGIERDHRGIVEGVVALVRQEIGAVASFKIHKRKIITQPMKGTSARSKDLNQDKKNKLFLQKDVKNLSE